MVRNIEVVCPLCGGSAISLVLENAVSRLLRCSTCDVRFVYPFPRPDSQGNYFSVKEGITSKDEEEESFISNRHRVLEKVEAAILRHRKGGAILDVGCATGYFLLQFFNTGNWTKFGVELSPNLARVASKKGLPVHVGPLDSARFENSEFDAITILDSLCYFSAPRRELHGIRRALSVNGVLAIESPLSSSRIMRAGRRLLQTSDHLFYYNPNSLSVLLRSCGFQILDVVPLPSNVQSDWLRKWLSVAYYTLTLALWRLSLGRIQWTPRFLVVAKREESRHQSQRE